MYSTLKHSVTVNVSGAFRGVNIRSGLPTRDRRPDKSAVELSRKRAALNEKRRKEKTKGGEE